MIFIIAEKEEEKQKTKRDKDGIGQFYNLPQYMKIYDVLKGAYSNYKVSDILSFYIYFRPAKINYMDFRHLPCHFQLLYKNLYFIYTIHIKNHIYTVYVVPQAKSKKFPKLFGYIIFICVIFRKKSAYAGDSLKYRKKYCLGNKLNGSKACLSTPAVYVCVY